MKKSLVILMLAMFAFVGCGEKKSEVKAKDVVKDAKKEAAGAVKGLKKEAAEHKEDHK